VLSFFVVWVPLLGLAVSGLGLVLGVTGLFLATFRKGAGIGFAIAGAGLNTLTLVIAVVFMLMIGAAANAIADKSTEKTDLPIAVQPNRVEEITSSQNNSEAEGKNSAAAAPADDWVTAFEGNIRKGDLLVRVSNMVLEKVPLKTFRAEVSEERFALISIDVTNKSTTRKIDVRGWGSDGMTLSSRGCTLRDDLGNVYRQVKFGLGTRIEGQLSSASLYPEKTLQDRICFELPVEAARTLFLELSAEQFGEDGYLRFQIPIPDQRPMSKPEEQPLPATPTPSEAVAVPGSVDVPTKGPEETSDSKVPSIAGDWWNIVDGKRTQRIRITQADAKFVAECSYNHKKEGNIRWTLTGEVHADGSISGKLVHTKSPADWVGQSHTAKLSDDGKSLVGKAVFDTGGGHDYLWRRN